jgi:deoxyinosine 3'endonuclease (endonuclease V)
LIMRVFTDRSLSPQSSSEEDWDDKVLTLSRQVRENDQLRVVAGVALRPDYANQKVSISGVAVSVSNWRPVSTRNETREFALVPPALPPLSKHEGILLGQEVISFLEGWDVSIDALFIEGHGIAQDGLGTAGVVGLSLAIPCIGVSVLFPQGCTQTPTHFRPGAIRGDRAALRLKSNNRVVGYSLVVQTNETPRYVSPGNNVSVETAVAMTLRSSPWNPEPEPLKTAKAFL